MSEETQRIYTEINKKKTLIEHMLTHEILLVCNDFMMLSKYDKQKGDFRPFFKKKVEEQFLVLDEHIADFKKLYISYLDSI